MTGSLKCKGNCAKLRESLVKKNKEKQPDITSGVLSANLIFPPLQTGPNMIGRVTTGICTLAHETITKINK